MTGNKNINKICVIITAIAVLVTVLFMNGRALGVTSIDTVSYEYENTLFDDSYVHTIDITIDDWDGFLETATSEEYSAADVTIDGEKVKNVGIRGKGNTSLSTVAQLGSDRYSFKIEFDAYETSGNYHGLDKLCLNNLIQDYTMMKDYITYKLMNEFGVASPLVSYCFITVNGEDWGLYLAVEAVEDSFLERNYGTNYGDLYKPDTMSMGGGRGNGGDFDMKNVDFDKMGMKNPFERNSDNSSSDGNAGDAGGEDDSGDTENSEQMPGDFDPSNMPEDFDSSNMPGGGPSGGGPGGGGFGLGSSDAKLQYIDDDIDSYSTIFNSAKTTANKADKKRLINSIKNLNEGLENSDSELIESAVDVEQLMRYMVVHNFVVDGDSYTGSMIHNFYLYEEDGVMTMLPWDYNLAFGTFQADDSTSAVNDPIDTPLSITEGSTDRPMFSWITSTEEYTEQYHEYFQEFLDQFYTSGYLTDLINTTYEMIHDYVDRDPTKFCTTEEFEKGVETISEFVKLRCESIEGQLDGTIPSTDSGQSADSSSLIDASAITLSDMGAMGGGMGGPGGGPGRSGSTEGDEEQQGDKQDSDPGTQEGTDANGEQQGDSENKTAQDANTTDDKTDSAAGTVVSTDDQQGPTEGMSAPEGMSPPDGFNPFGNTDNSTDGTQNSVESSDASGNAQSGFPSGGFPGGDSPFGDFGQTSTISVTNYIYMGISVGAILAAILFAVFFKRKRLHI
ncbi:CotH kinase family protein [Butyrivibrio sp. XPD2002]|uniref:CotH kinase family protein n=1 Tax=Butyrivibrio sp. XPD2002 TaxID=1280665 RepID=UPI00042218F0|nr:CotH kinase family protein [Butyrivibrio sp. XPD2002]